MDKQPAVKSYFFGKGYKVLFNTIGDAWNSNELSAEEVRRKIKLSKQTHSNGKVMQWLRRIKNLFRWFEFFSIYFFGSAICVILSSIHMLILVSFMLVIYAAFMLIWLFDRGYIIVKRIFGACPKCKGRYSMPVYVCKCGAEHTRLTPGVYGILHRKCLCGRKLPTTFFNGRRMLTSKCPHCGNINEGREAVPICVPVIGGPSVGKTCFITALMKELTEKVCPLSDMNLSFYDYRNKVECTQMIDKYNKGILQTKTSDTNPAAFNFFVSGKGIMPERLMYLYDIAGEAFGITEALSAQKQYEYCHGFIFLIDPLSISNIRQRFEDEDGFKNYSVGTEDIDDTFDVFLSNLKRISGLSANKLMRVPCAVVINKADAFDLNERIGKDSAERLAAEQGQGFKDAGQAMSHLCREFLSDNGMNNFVNNIELCFKNRRYFSCSAIGHIQNGQGFEPTSVFAPFAWIVSCFDKKLKRKFDAYLANRIKIKIGNKRIKLPGGKIYRVLSKTKYNGNRYFCVVECDSCGKISAADAKVYYRNKTGDSGGFTEFNLRAQSEEDKLIMSRLNLAEWNIKLKYYAELSTGAKPEAGKSETEENV